MSHLHEANQNSTWLHRALLHLYATFPIFSLRVFRWGGELSLRPVIGPAMRPFIDWFARNVESGQVISFAEVEELVQDAKSCSIGDCPCLRVYHDNCGHGGEKCVRLNIAHDVFTTRNADAHRTIDKVDLLHRLRELSSKWGMHHAKIFLGGQQVYAICTCCDNCIACAMLTRYGQPNALKKGRYISRVDTERCAGCGGCTRVCRFGAMDAGNVDGSKCFGCGLCNLECERGAVSMVLRDVKAVDGCQLSVASSEADALQDAATSPTADH